MEIFFKYHLSWFFLGSISLLLVGFYVLLRIVAELLRHIHIDNRWEIWIAAWIKKVILFYPFAASTLLMSIWIFVNPIWHFSIALFLLLVSFEHLKNIFRGLLLKAADEVNIGAVLRVGELQGEVSEMRPLGLYLINNDGLHFLSYQTLATQGYIIVQRPDIAGFCLLKIVAEAEKQQQSQKLKELLISTPYVDWAHPLQVVNFHESEDYLQVKVFLRENHYKSKLLQLMDEWGYSCELVN
jgi:hypothetical protein